MAGDLVAAAREAAGPELRELRVFDVYRGEQVGEGRSRSRSSLAFQSPERTLSDEDAAAIRERIVTRSPSASAPSCAPRPQSDRAVPPYKVSDAPTGSHCFAAAVAVVLVPAVVSAAAPQLIGTVGPGFSIRLENPDGTSVSQLDPGTYEMRTGRSAVSRPSTSGPDEAGGPPLPGKVAAV